MKRPYMPNPNTHQHTTHTNPSIHSSTYGPTDLDLLELGQLHDAGVDALVGRAEVAEDAVQLVAFGGAREERPAVGHLCVCAVEVWCWGEMGGQSFRRLAMMPEMPQPRPAGFARHDACEMMMKTHRRRCSRWTRCRRAWSTCASPSARPARGTTASPPGVVFCV